ncbi:MAG: leucine--tRNA ligase [archaeon]
MINFKKIEQKWQKRWEKDQIFKTKETTSKKKFYCLEMFPYPSGTGLHMGHAFNYTVGDIYSRFKRMNGFNVLYPMGYDSFGLPAENAAIKAKIHPKKFTEAAIKNFISQQKSLGLSYDWSRMVKSHDPEYYKWGQWIFLKMLEKGLAYRKKAPVNFCPKCDTVLANEQVHNGKCWRHEDTNVEIKNLEQWFLKTTEYAEELYDNIDKLNWPERIKLMQRNWIGKSHGTEIQFEINKEKWPIFTTRPDTICGVTFMVVSAQHPKLKELVTKKQEQEVQEFLKKIRSTSEKDFGALEKEGAFTGSHAINPVTGYKIPIYTGNFVVADYASGMVMAVPAHDQRDFEFAKKYNLPIKAVIQPETDLDTKNMTQAYIGEGKLINSKEFDGLKNKEAIKQITEHLEHKKLGKKTLQYKLRDWLISRQRYWGTPIPVVYCDKCGIIPETKLPVLLPEKVTFGKGNPLKTNKDFVNAKCPKCKGKARRETDTMDTFFDSSWYYLRYCDSTNKKEPFSKKKVNYWMPVDQYIGGAEHACMHLIYARFFTKVLRDMKLVKADEPFAKLFNQGMLHGADGEKMSKSKGNALLPETVSEKYGIDTARLFLVSIASPDRDIQWSETGIDGSLRFIKRVVDHSKTLKLGKSSKIVESKINKTIKELSEDIENFRYNLAVIKLRSLFDSLEEEISKKDFESFVKLLSLFCPHLAEELWEKIGNKSFVSLQAWPKADEKKIDKKLEEQEKAIDKLTEDINHVVRLVKGKKEKVYIYVLPQEKNLYEDNLELLEKKIELKIKVYAVNDKDKYDPENKSKKTKPGKPAIYLE